MAGRLPFRSGPATCVMILPYQKIVHQEICPMVPDGRYKDVKRDRNCAYRIGRGLFLLRDGGKLTAESDALLGIRTDGGAAGRPVLPCPLSGSGPAVAGPAPGTPGRAVTGISGTHGATAARWPSHGRSRRRTPRPQPGPAAARFPFLRVAAGVGHLRPSGGSAYGSVRTRGGIPNSALLLLPGAECGRRGIRGRGGVSAPAEIHPCGKGDRLFRSAGSTPLCRPAAVAGPGRSAPGRVPRGHLPGGDGAFPVERRAGRGAGAGTDRGR